MSRMSFAEAGGKVEERTMNFEELMTFVEHDMRMSHIYQPVMIRALLDSNGRASVSDIARQLLIEDRSQLEYYAEITKNMVGRVLTNRKVVVREGTVYELPALSQLTPDQVRALRSACDQRISEYISRRGDAIWEHRRRSAGYISGTLRYEVLKAAKFRCELCGVSAEERALEVDHIMPRNKGGTDEIANLQALCYSCNAMKRDRDDTDFRVARAAYDRKGLGCPFCEIGERPVVLQNELALVIKDKYAVSEWHSLVIPKRHTADYFDLGTAEVRACHQLLAEARTLVLQQDASVLGFNVGINAGEAAGQTVMHCHIHLIPRRAGDNANPRGGVRCVVPGKADYTQVVA
jgi:diadenosine tetraphosphate (Ap4A) HIT family hydrolase/5-methylcytosine-specific restriction endonuclease McrA